MVEFSILPTGDVVTVIALVAEGLNRMNRVFNAEIILVMTGPTVVRRIRVSHGMTRIAVIDVVSLL